MFILFWRVAWRGLDRERLHQPDVPSVEFAQSNRCLHAFTIGSLAPREPIDYPLLSSRYLRTGHGDVPLMFDDS